MHGSKREILTVSARKEYLCGFAPRKLNKSNKKLINKEEEIPLPFFLYSLLFALTCMTFFFFFPHSLYILPLYPGAYQDGNPNPRICVSSISVNVPADTCCIETLEHSEYRKSRREKRDTKLKIYRVNITRAQLLSHNDGSIYTWHCLIGVEF